MDTFKGYGRRSVSPVVMPPSVIVTNTPSVEDSPRRRTLMMHDEFDRFLSDFRMVIMTDTEFNNFIEKLKFTIMSDDQKRLIGQMLRTSMMSLQANV